MKVVFDRLKVISKWDKEKELEENVKKIGHFSGTNMSRTTNQFSSNLVCEVVYMEGITMQINFGKNQTSSYRDTRSCKQ